MADLQTTNSDMPEIVWSKINNHYEHLTTETLESIIRQEVRNAKMAFISLGFFLRVAKEQETWRKQGYESIWEYAEREFHISRSTASRYMEINRRFSKEGCSAILDERYQDYNVGQLQEMLTLPDMQKVTPDMTVKEIRALKPKKAKKEEVPETEMCATSHMEEIPAASTDELVEVEELPVAKAEDLVENVPLEITDDIGEPLEVEEDIENTYTDEWFVKNFFDTEEAEPYLTQLVELCRNTRHSIGEEMSDRVEARAICCPNNCLNTIETQGMMAEFKSLLFGVTFHVYINGNELKRHMGWGYFLRLIDKLYNDETIEDDGPVADEPEPVAEPETVAAPEPETEPIRIEVSLSAGDAEKKWDELTEGNGFDIRGTDIYGFLLEVKSELKNYRTCNEDGTMPEDVMKRKEADVMAYKLLFELVQEMDEIKAKRLEEGVE